MKSFPRLASRRAWVWAKLLCLAALLLRTASAGAAPSLALETPFVWTDEKAVVRVDAPDGEMAISIKTITRGGWGKAREERATVRAGRLEITPFGEGLHIVQLKGEPPAEVRFVAMQPPPPLSQTGKAALRCALPRNADKLLRGAPFTVLAMGDSVTKTGEYPLLLAMMLRRATGNAQISVVKRAHAGKSVDASVRSWDKEGPPSAPDLGLLMYGLNDQAAGTSLDAYLEQSAWLVERLHKLGADAVLLRPTPHIDFPFDAASTVPRAYPLRTLGFGAALDTTFHGKVPVVDTFSALWGSGAPTLQSSVQSSVQSLWPLYPPHPSKTFQTLLESGGKGDTIHPNALGHLQIARAIFDNLTGAASDSPLQMRGESVWTRAGVVSRLRVRNVSGVFRAGRLEVHAPPDASISLAAPLTYALPPQGEMGFEVVWQDARTPADLGRYPHNVYLAPGRPYLAVVDFGASSSHAYVAALPFAPDVNFVRERQVVAGQRVRVKLREAKTSREVPVTIPPDAMVGRLPLSSPLGNGWAVAELAYTRFGAARSGQAIIDGDLDEWQGHIWVPVGEAVQARWTRGPQDNRASVDECFTRWSFKAGQNGLYAAAQVRGKVEKDAFTLFFDPRPPALLGTAGPYFWLSGGFKPDGILSLSKGETSDRAPELRGAWRQTEDGVTLELFVPYALMNSQNWPASGDLGVSIWWTHIGLGGQKTHLMWSEDGHPWNTRWYGVVRRFEGQSSAALPLMVRVK